MKRYLSRAGFTIIELCLAMAIFSAAIGVLYGVYRAAIAAARDGAAVQEADQIARFCLERMSKELKSAYVAPATNQIRFIGTNNIFFGRDADRVNFFSVFQVPAAGRSPRSELCEISYFIDNDEATAARWLQRRLDSLPDKNVSSGGKASLLGRFVRGLNFRYFDGRAWQDSWDSHRQVPSAVEITLTLEISRRQKTYLLVVPLDVGRFDQKAGFAL